MVMNDKITDAKVRSTLENIITNDVIAHYDALPQETELDLMVRFMRADSLYGALLTQYREVEQQILAARRRYDIADAELSKFVVSKNPRVGVACLQSIIRSVS